VSPGVAGVFGTGPSGKFKFVQKTLQHYWLRQLDGSLLIIPLHLAPYIFIHVADFVAIESLHHLLLCNNDSFFLANN
jgi:hypothetical protein